ncbi:hypothetical protein [Acinetobacter puyangensis]|nr:hypothetical protein [Acinetobacter puyangensis]
MGFTVTQVDRRIELIATETPKCRKKLAKSGMAVLRKVAIQR